jgi:hypothetical protein
VTLASGTNLERYQLEVSGLDVRLVPIEQGKVLLQDILGEAARPTTLPSGFTNVLSSNVPAGHERSTKACRLWTAQASTWFRPLRVLFMSLTCGAGPLGFLCLLSGFLRLLLGLTLSQVRS